LKTTTTKFCLFVTEPGKGTRALRYGRGNSTGKLAGRVRLFTTRKAAVDHGQSINLPFMVKAVRPNDLWARQ
jgi:hypothetical protein